MRARPDITQPRVLVPTAEQLRALQRMFGFEGPAVVVALPPAPESAVIEAIRGMDRKVEAMAGDLKRVAKTHQDLREENEELRKGKAALAAMHAEGLFAFARAIDREAREQFLAVMACGDVAKAARELDLKDSTLRSRLMKWPERGRAYAALAEIIRWRKAIKGQVGMDLAKRVASGGERDVDFPALIRDVVTELEELDPENWEERCRSLADALRKAVS